MIPLSYYLVLSAVLFALGLSGLVIHRRNLINLLLCIELLLLAVNTQLIALSYYLEHLSAQVMVFFVLTVTAAETAVALAILVRLFHAQGTIAIGSLNQLKG